MTEPSVPTRGPACHDLSPEHTPVSPILLLPTTFWADFQLDLPIQPPRDGTSTMGELPCQTPLPVGSRAWFSFKHPQIQPWAISAAEHVGPSSPGENHPQQQLRESFINLFFLQDKPAALCPFPGIRIGVIPRPLQAANFYTSTYPP